LKGIKIIHEVIFIIAINYEFTLGPKLITSISTKCSARMRVIIRSKLYQETPFEDEFDLIEAAGRGMNEQVNFGVYIKDLDKYEIMYERISIAAKF
jgi:hypothetical protein